MTSNAMTVDRNLDASDYLERARLLVPLIESEAERTRTVSDKVVHALRESGALRAARLGNGSFAGGKTVSSIASGCRPIAMNATVLGKEPGKTFIPTVQHVQVPEDPEKTWHQIGGYFYNNLRMYSQFTSEATSVTSP